MKKTLLLLSILLWASFGYSQNIFPTTGNVGIGTNTPDANSILHIRGTHANTNAMFELPAASNGNNTGKIVLKAWASEPEISWEGTGIGANINNWGLTRYNNALSSSYIRFVPHPTVGYMLFSTITGGGIKHDNVMAIVNNMVGIGTTSPSRKLEVISETNNIAYFRDNSTASEVVFRGNPTNTILDFGNRPLQVQFNSVPSFTMNTLGNMGIGTTSPTEKLEVNGNLQLSGTIKFGNAGVRTEYRNNAGLQGNAGALSGFYETYAPLNFPKDDSNWWHLIDSRHSNPTNNYAMQIAGSFFDQKLYFRKTNSNPTEAWKEFVAVDAVGRINLDNDAAASKRSVTLGGYVYGGAIRFNANSAVANNRNLELGNLDNNGIFYPSMVVSSETGNVGIGTQAPTGKFEISSSNSSAKFKIGDVAGNSINHLSWNTGAAINVPDQGGANPLIYFRKTDYNNLNNFTDVFQVKSDGSIQAFGQVRGSDIVSTGTNSWIFHTPDDGRKNMFIAPGLGASDGSSGWDWGKGMVLNNDGSVGISANTVPTGFKLAVGGDIIAERVVVKLQANWPDFVFKKNYGLRPLSEVEAFINQNNHLPEIPSAKEVAERGIDVGDMNAKLLQKVEELTLYLIEMKKENEKQAKENIRQSEEIEKLKLQVNK